MKNIKILLVILLVLSFVLVILPSQNEKNTAFAKFMATTTSSGNANVTNNPLNAGCFSYDIDSNNYPHILWLNGHLLNHEEYLALRYIRWDGENWVCMDGSEYSPEISVENDKSIINDIDRSVMMPQLCLDNSDCPHIVWIDVEYVSEYEGYTYLAYMKQDGDDWVCSDGSKYDKSMEVKENPLYIGNLDFLQGYPSISIDSENNPHLTYLGFDFDSADFDMGLVYIIQNSDGEWTALDGSEFDDKNLKPENPAVLPYEFDDDMLINNLRPVLDENDNPHFAIVNFDMDICYFYWDGEKWSNVDGSEFNPDNLGEESPSNVSKNESYSAIPFMDLDSNGYPHIVWWDDKGGYTLDFMYVRYDGENWVCVDGSIFDGSGYNPDNPAFITGADYCLNPTVKIDNNDNAHISWVSIPDPEDTLSDTYYMKWEDGKWVCIDGSDYSPENPAANVTKSYNTTMSSEFVFDIDGNPHFVWLDGVMSFDSFALLFSNVYGDLYYIHWDGGNWVNAGGEVYEPVTNN